MLIVRSIGLRQPGRVAGSGRRLDRNDAKCVLFVLIADGYIFSRSEGVRSEAVSGLVVIHTSRIVVEHPAGMLAAARLVHELPGLVVLAMPEPAHPAVLALFAPQVGIDAAVAIERRHEFVAPLRRSLRKFLGPGQFETNAFELVR